jgi:serine kinase of HPr protein (carbohydrate metabolism regulator)
MFIAEVPEGLFTLILSKEFTSPEKLAELALNSSTNITRAETESDST